jgi:amino acid adenylation domain-containing protein
MSGNDFDSVPRCFRIAAAERPNCIAVRSATERLTYAGLDARTDVLCGQLTDAGIGKGALVGILLDRSVSAITSMLAVLKAGGAFVPLDPNSPPQGIVEIVRRHKLACVVSDEATLRCFPQLAGAAPVIDTGASPLAEAASRPVQAAKISGSDPACVMFTSGSTGKPKGVIITHRGIVRLVKNSGFMDFSSDQTFLHLSHLTFDASIFEIWGALLNGAQLVVAPPGLLSLDAIATTIEAQGVTAALLTSGLFHLMVDQRPDALRRLRYLVSGGDVLSPEHVRKAARLLTSGHFIAAYGPTENTSIAACYTVPPDWPADGPVPLGWPIDGTVVDILDDDMRPVLDGSPGQLCLSGDGQALGYLDDPDLTERKFIAVPDAIHRNGEEPAQPLYLTGDLVRRDEKGMLQFLGRIDNQIKVNGHRIEPEHVETVLRQHLPLTDIAVVACALANGAKHLVAFVVALPEVPLSEESVLDAAASLLPPHMVPTRVETVEVFPLTKTGKIDRRALSQLAAAARGKVSLEDIRATPFEALLVDLWRHQLGLATIDLDKNFFDLGGTSLQLLGVHGELERHFPGKLSVNELFELPTIRLLSDRLSGKPSVKFGASAAGRAKLQQGARKQRAAYAAGRVNSPIGD